MKGVLIAAGVLKDGDWVREALKEADWIVAIDGGLGSAIACQVVPDLLLGDLDSLSSRSARVGERKENSYRILSQRKKLYRYRVGFC